MPKEAENRALVEAFWKTLYVDGDVSRIGDFFAPDGHYEDVPAPDAGATGPKNIEKRLRIGLDPVEKFTHVCHRMVCEGDTVMTEHTETWVFKTGESTSLPFVSVHVIEDGKFKLWRDYWDLNTLMSQAPPWWIEHIAKFSAEDFTS